MGHTDLDGSLRRDVVGEVAGVEVGLETTHGDDELRALNCLLGVGVGDRADVDLGDKMSGSKT